MKKIVLFIAFLLSTVNIFAMDKIYSMHPSQLYMKVSYPNNKDIYYPVKTRIKRKVKKQKEYKPKTFITFNISRNNKSILSDQYMGWSFEEEGNSLNLGIGIEKQFIFKKNNMFYIDTDIEKEYEQKGDTFPLTHQTRLGLVLYNFLIEGELYRTNLETMDFTETEINSLDGLRLNLGFYFNRKLRLSFGQLISSNSFDSDKIYQISYKILNIKNMVTEISYDYNHIKYVKDNLNYDKSLSRLRIGVGWAF